MKRFCIGLIFLLALGVGTSSAEILGGINNDGKIGLDEAVSVLQVTAGVISPSQVPTYDFREYYIRETVHLSTMFSGIPPLMTPRIQWRFSMIYTPIELTP